MELIKRLVTLSTLCSFQLDEEILSLYEKILTPFGVKAIRAIEEIIVTRSSRDPFPSVADIKKVMDPEMTEQDDGVIVSERIWAAIAKYGWPNYNEAREYIGELGWEVVQQHGGWVYTCENANKENGAQFRAQIRDLARTISKRRRLGLFEDRIKITKSDLTKLGFDDVIKKLE